MIEEDIMNTRFERTAGVEVRIDQMLTDEHYHIIAQTVVEYMNSLVA